MKADTTSLGDLLRAGARKLEAGGIPTASLDARLLLQHCGGFTRNEIITQEHDPVSPEKTEAFNAHILRRMTGEPVNRILGEQEFLGRCFEIDSNTLAPRQDTEVVLESAVDRIRDSSNRPRILDVGTGTGILAITLACEVNHSEIFAVDISPSALVTARRNAERHGVADRITWLEGDLFEPVEGCFDLVISNPPYVRSGDIDQLDREVRNFDPVLALDGGPDGLDFYRRIFSLVQNHLYDDGIVVVEIGHDQARPVCEIAMGNGFETEEIMRDLAGNDRALIVVLDEK